MKAKLIKTEQGYHLDTGKADGLHLACYPHDITKQKLSLKNCQAIENGYDLDELADDFIRCPEDMRTLSEDREINSFKKGFQKALEILGDKKFSEEDMRKALHKLADSFMRGYPYDKDLDFQEGNEIIQSLQQTEWDVEVEVEKSYLPVSKTPKVKDSRQYTYIPKLDANNCLILKRI